MILIKSVLEDLSGKDALVIGRSLLFGKPMAHLLLQENCTVTMAHSRTKDLEAHCKRADILVAAVGVPKLVKGDWIKPGAVVIDVGINRMEDGKLCGDVDFEAAQGVAEAITPVPGRRRANDHYLPIEKYAYSCEEPPGLVFIPSLIL